MNDLRLVLLGLGVLLLAGIWLWSLYARRRSGSSRSGSSGRGKRAGRRRGVPKDGAGDTTGPTSDPPFARRGENLALDFALDPDDEGPVLPPLGLDDSDVEGDDRGDVPAPGRDEAHAPDSERAGSRRDARGRGAGSEAGSRRRAARARRQAPVDDDDFFRAGEDAVSASPTGNLQGSRGTREAPEQLDTETNDPHGNAPGPAAGDAVDTNSDEDRAQAETLVVILTVLAPKGERIEGAALRAAFQAQGLRYGEDRIFHRYPETAPASAGPVFSAVNIVEPGVFDPGTMDSMQTPGVGLFMRLPGPMDPGDAFKAMVEAARELADALEVQLCDETRSKLTPQTLNHLREQIADFGRRRLLRV